MAMGPRKLRLSELCRLLNSTPLGEVIGERQLHRHRTRAGLRIGDTRHVDLLRYVAWLVNIRHAPKSASGGDPYEVVKDRARARNIALSLAGRDIGDLPAVGNPGRKARAASDVRFFCDSYFPLTFHLPWSKDHLKVIARIEQAVLRGGLFALAMPRGSGKSTICECACIWAVLYGHREFVCLIGSDEGHAMDMLDSIKMELDGNDLLLEDSPEVAYPIQCLDGIANRCKGRHFKGERTHISWTARDIVLPTIPRWSTRSRPTRSCGSSTPRSAPRACARVTRSWTYRGACSSGSCAGGRTTSPATSSTMVPGRTSAGRTSLCARRPDPGRGDRRGGYRGGDLPGAGSDHVAVSAGRWLRPRGAGRERLTAGLPGAADPPVQ